MYVHISEVSQLKLHCKPNGDRAYLANSPVWLLPLAIQPWYYWVPRPKDTSWQRALLPRTSPAKFAYAIFVGIRYLKVWAFEKLRPRIRPWHTTQILRSPKLSTVELSLDGLHQSSHRRFILWHISISNANMHTILYTYINISYTIYLIYMAVCSNPNGPIENVSFNVTICRAHNLSITMYKDFFSPQLLHHPITTNSVQCDTKNLIIWLWQCW